MPRILFEKTGNGIWISHLDLMRVFQRAFRRGGMPLKHSQGFNPHAYVSLALPLSVGVESFCEILDYELDEAMDCGLVVERLNEALPQGVRCICGYEDGLKIKYLTHLQGKVLMEYDGGCGAEMVAQLQEFFDRPVIEVEKRTKNKGMVLTDIKPMIISCQAGLVEDGVVELEFVVCAQNPTLNPALLVTALEKNCPQLAPDFAKVTRLNTLQGDLKPFR